MRAQSYHDDATVFLYFRLFFSYLLMMLALYADEGVCVNAKVSLVIPIIRFLFLFGFFRNLFYTDKIDHKIITFIHFICLVILAMIRC